jgi:hypothetical protein
MKLLFQLLNVFLLSQPHDSIVQAFGVVVPSLVFHQSLSGGRASRSSFLSSSASSSALFYGEEPPQEVSGLVENLVFQSPVLKQLYPALLQHKQNYGNPNIPLGTKEGRQCQTLRRLHIQNKLTDEEVTWLQELGFTFHSLEDVYRFADFNDLFQRLVAYEKENQVGYQIPKKYPQDPELGAWVTGIRRLGQEGVNPHHGRRLDAIGFAWKSTRKCGSAFMNQYREFVVQVGEEGLDAVLKDPKTLPWIKAQQEALKRGSLSQTRVHYMGDLFGDTWTTMGRL